MGIDAVQYRGTMRKDLKQLYKTYQKLITEGPHMEVERFSCKGSWLVEDKKSALAFSCRLMSGNEEQMYGSKTPTTA